MRFQISEEIKVIEGLLLSTTNEERRLELNMMLEFLKEQIGVQK